MSYEEEEAPKKEGYLNKRSHAWPHNFAYRYVKVENHVLSYYPSYDVNFFFFINSKELDKCRGLLKMRDATVNYFEESPYGFIISEPKKEDGQNFIFSASNDEERDNWMYFLEKAIT
jgi:hypothetical protein